MTTVTYPVVSHFYTVQGEGSFAGHPAYFIRLAGCDVGCPWCDTKESWQIDGHPVIDLISLESAIHAAGARTVVVTGGEPTMHDLAPLSETLSDAGFRLHIETSGAHPLSGNFDWVTLSPKKFKPPVESIFEKTNELKVVIAGKADFEWAEKHRTLVPEACKLLLQPEWDSPHMLKSIVSYVKSHPDWSISLQTHKYLNIP